MGCQHASMKVTRDDSDTNIPESVRMSFATTIVGTIGLQETITWSSEVTFMGEELKFQKDNSPSNKARVNIHWNGEKFEPKEIKKIAKALRGKKEKLELMRILDEAGILKDKCDGAADILSLAVSAISQPIQ